MVCLPFNGILPAKDCCCEVAVCTQDEWAINVDYDQRHVHAHVQVTPDQYLNTTEFMDSIKATLDAKLADSKL